MRLLLSHIILPLPLFWIGIFLAVILRLFKRKAISLVITYISFAWLFIISTPFIPNLLVGSLESKYHAISETTIKDLRQTSVNILVLGGGFVNDKSLPPNDQLSEVALSRLIEGIRINKLLSHSKIITSGYGGKENTSQAEVLVKTALLLGVDSSFLQIQSKPTNTWQEALKYKKNFGDTTQLILVTSAVHMPRAMYLFHKAGLDPIPAPTNHLIKTALYEGAWSWIPSSGNIRKVKIIIHEYVGLLWCWINNYFNE